jgi:hypothetical protein
LEKQLLTYIGLGVTVSLACEAVGISRECLYNWVREDEAFSDRYNQAVAQLQARWLKIAEGHPQAAVKLLSKRFRDEWGDHVAVGVTGDTKLVIEVVERDAKPRGQSTDTAPASAGDRGQPGEA